MRFFTILVVASSAVIAMAACSSSTTSSPSGGGGGTSGSAAPSCDTACAHLTGVCAMITTANCASECPSLSDSQRTCASSASDCVGFQTCLSTGSGQDAGGGTTGQDSGGGGGGGGDTTVGTCPSRLKSGETSSPCTLTIIDGHSMCLMSCAKDSDCTDSTYNGCFALSSACTPSCSSAGDCTPYGFNICSGTRCE